jgi:hypothetical protein
MGSRAGLDEDLADVGRVLIIYVVALAAWYAWRTYRDARRAREDLRDRQTVTLREESLAALERGVTLPVYRRGRTLELRGEVVREDEAEDEP